MVDPVDDSALLVARSLLSCLLYQEKEDPPILEHSTLGMYP